MAAPPPKLSDAPPPRVPDRPISPPAPGAGTFLPLPSRLRRRKASARQRLHRFFMRPSTEVLVGGMIVASVGLTIMELSVDPLSASLPLLTQINNVITAIFVVELVLRFAAASSKRRFFGEFWLDTIAVAVSLVAMQAALNPLRMIRLLRLVGLLSRFAGLYHYVVRRAALELVIALGLILLTVVSGSAALLAFEKGGAVGPHTYGEAFWASLYSLFAGEPIPASPGSFGGRIIIVLIMFMGMSTFAMFTGTVSAYMVNRLRAQGDFVDEDELKDHLVICGWNRKAEIIAREWVAHRGNDTPPVVVIGEIIGDQPITDAKLKGVVRFINDDFTRVSALEQARIRSASTCVILSDTGKSRTEHDADARTIMTALTIERMCPSVYTCAELNHEEYSPHLKIAKVNDYVVTGEHNAYLLAQATLNCGLTAVFSELLTHERGNSFYRLDVPDSWIGKTFVELLIHLKNSRNAILIGVRPITGEVLVNPTSYTFKGGEQAVVIAERDIEV
jgi:voltage-gated potassium channel